MSYANEQQRPRLIAGLRSLAAYLEANPDVPAPNYTDVMVFARGGDDVMRTEIDRVAALTGSEIECEYLPDHYRMSRRFGPVTYTAVAIFAASRARHDALVSYDGAVTPDETPEEV